jgi:hypothetical protein
MKKLFFRLMIMVLLLSTVPTQMWASEPNPTAMSSCPKDAPPEVKAMLLRLDEIKAMDKSSLTRSEKKALRKEVRSIKAALAENRGIYLSFAAIIIIILLLVLLL